MIGDSVLKKQQGVSFIEMLLVVLVIALVVALVINSYQHAVKVERRTIAQQALMTSVSLQERWYLRLHEYARDIKEVGGEHAAGDHYQLRVTQDPCGNTSCFTITATAIGEQLDDKDCQKMSVNHIGQRRALSYHNRDTTDECWD